MNDRQGETKHRLDYGRSPYAVRLCKAHFQLIMLDGYTVPTYGSQSELTTSDRAVLVSFCKLLTLVAVERKTRCPLACYVNRGHLQGVLIREIFGNAWFRKGHRNPVSDDRSLCFEDVTHRVEKGTG